jgi:hypothetical protein
MDNEELFREVHALRVAIEGAQFLPRAEAELRSEAVLREVAVLRSEMQTEIEAVREDLRRMQEWQIWAVRLIAATIVTVLITGIAGAVIRLA